MTLQIVPTLPSERSALRDFLQHNFQSAVQVNSFDPDVLAWKYFSFHPQWSEARSYLVKKCEKIVAHAGIWPLRLATGTRELKVIHMIDWAASRAEPGVGVMLLRQFASMCDLLLTIGGSDDTRAILPKIGYRQCGELKLQARVVRPLKQVNAGKLADWKGWLRALRNVGLSLQPLPKVPSDWSISKVSQFAGQMPSFPARAGLISEHSAAELNYLLSCPGARFSGFTISQSGRARGYFILSQIQGQTRIVDLGIDGDDPKHRPVVCILAAHTAAKLSETREIVAGFSDTQRQKEFAGVGFKVRQTLPVFCYDPGKLMGVEAASLTMLDGDICFMANLKHPYLL